MLVRCGDSPHLSQVGLLCNTEDAGLFSNVSRAMELGLPEVNKQPITPQHAVICGGGPSLADTLENIRELKNKGAKVFALNNTAKFLAKHGIRADAQILVDPRGGNVEFVDEVWTDEVFLASQCHPDLFDKCKEIGYPVRLWHAATDGLEKYAPQLGGKHCHVGGGLTVGLAGLCLLHVLGHRQIHLFGYDSSHAQGKSHAYRQDMNRDDEMVTAAVENRLFHCSLAMVGQAHEFKNVSTMLQDFACTLHVYGDGLLPTLWRAWQKEKTERTLTAVYDLGLSPAGFDFSYFLREAEKYRKTNKFDHIDVVFQPGPMFGFRNEDPLPSTEHQNEMLWKVCVGAARKHTSVRNIKVCKKRETIAGAVFPEGYLEDAPKSCFTEVQLERTS